MLSWIEFCDPLGFGCFPEDDPDLKKDTASSEGKILTKIEPKKKVPDSDDDVSEDEEKSNVPIAKKKGNICALNMKVNESAVLKEHVAMSGKPEGTEIDCNIEQLVIMHQYFNLPTYCLSFYYSQEPK